MFFNVSFDLRSCAALCCVLVAAALAGIDWWPACLVSSTATTQEQGIEPALFTENTHLDTVGERASGSRFKETLNEQPAGHRLVGGRWAGGRTGTGRGCLWPAHSASSVQKTVRVKTTSKRSKNFRQQREIIVFQSTCSIAVATLGWLV